MTIPIERLRELFPIKSRYSYFLSSASGPLPAPTVAALNQFTESMMYESAKAFFDWMAEAEVTRKRAATLLDCAVESVGFAKNTSFALWLASRIIDWRDGDELLLPRGEFPANIVPWLALEEQGVKVKWLEPESPDYLRPRVTLDSVMNSITENTRALSVSFVQFDDGVRRDVNALGQLCKERGIIYIIDAIQGLGVLPFSCRESQADFVASGSQKWLLSPPGAGLLYVAPHWLVGGKVPNMGWFSLERPFDYDIETLSQVKSRIQPSAKRFEEGTMNYSEYIGLSKSLELLLAVGIENITSRVKFLTDRLCAGLTQLECQIVSPREGSLWSGIVSFKHPSVSSTDIHRALLNNAVITSLRADCVRVAVHFFNDETEIDKLLHLLEANR